MHSGKAGFTAIELVVAIVLVAAAAALVLWQKQDITTYHQDLQRKTAVNTMYHNLEEIHFPASKSYPQKIDGSTLRGLDPELLKDPEGRALGEPGSDYQYEPFGCMEGKCKGYTLRATLRHEADFIKGSSS
jgi:prepilin-type N-terminal cleavage/methylation domain-containing protein